ncbi:hypothetical protein D3C74_288880 [compost metagenome]
MPHMVHVQHREFMLQGIIAEMIAERTFKSAFVRRYEPRYCEFRLGRNPVAAQRILCHRELFAQDERSDQQLGQMLGNRRNSRGYHGRRAAQEYGNRQRLPAFLGFVVVEPSAFLDLPVYSGRLIVVQLNPVHPQVIFFRL